MVLTLSELFENDSISNNKRVQKPISTHKSSKKRNANSQPTTESNSTRNSSKKRSDSSQPITVSTEKITAQKEPKFEHTLINTTYQINESLDFYDTPIPRHLIEFANESGEISEKDCNRYIYIFYLIYYVL